jgi:hypothetical protein
MQRVVIKNRCSLSHMRRSLSMSAYSFDAEGKKTTRLREMFEKKDLAFLMYAYSRATFFFSFNLYYDTSRSMFYEFMIWIPISTYILSFSQKKIILRDMF